MATEPPSGAAGSLRLPPDHSNAAAAVGAVGGVDRDDTPGPRPRVLSREEGVVMVAAAAASAVVPSGGRPCGVGVDVHPVDALDVRGVDGGRWGW